MARQLIEIATDMILKHIKENMSDALTDIRSDRNLVENLGLATPVPREYFIAKNYTALQPPSVFIVCDDIDFKKERGANHINAVAHYGITAISEAQTTEAATRITWRYQAALSQILDNVSLTNASDKLKLTVIVRNAEFSEDYEVSSKEGNPAKRWRKGVLLRCDVEFREEL